MMNIYTNRTPKDTMRAAFLTHAKGVNEILIASPFYSYDVLLKEILETNKDCLVRLIVRLGPATSPDALKTILSQEKVQIRYFTSSQFHSKIYIFGGKTALIGSANLTEAGFQSNREVCLSIDQEHDCFDELLKLYNSYWSQAEVLTPERLQRYAVIYGQDTSAGDYRLEKKIMENFGDISPTEGIQVGRKKQTKEKIFLESYNRTYQEFLTAYKDVENYYKLDGRRKQPEDIVPLRIEVDQFFSFIRERFAGGDSWKFAPIIGGEEQAKLIKEKLDQWFSERWAYLDENIPTSIVKINNAFSLASIEQATIEQIFDGLDTCHSFYERLRFFHGGHETLKKVFLSENNIAQLRMVLTYLLYGKDNFIIRMGNCIFDEKYDLKQIGRSVVQELLGWVNKENIPICNGRTVKALRYLGYNVVVFT